MAELAPLERMTMMLPVAMRRKVAAALDLAEMAREVHNPRTLLGMLPSAARGMIVQQGRRGESTDMVSGHATHFDWTYRSDFPEMRALYTRAKQNQWDGDVALDWSIDVDPENPEVPLLPEGFFDGERLEAVTGVKLTERERRDFVHCTLAWMLSQFLHGEQGALHAAAQVTESVHWLDAKLYGATQVMDEGRHVEVFHRYLEEKLGKVYVINDNLFTIIDALVTDPRWDMKFLGMQIMVEGLALGAFGTIYRITGEPLLKQMLGYVIQDEARHVHYGVLALRDHIKEHLSDRERREREDWAFEVALLMRNRFMVHEVYEEWFEGIIPRRTWDRLVAETPGMREFRQVMFSRLIPNLRAIGLMPERMMRHYEQAGLLAYYDAPDASQLTAERLLADLETGPSVVVDRPQGVPGPAVLGGNGAG